jgi:very-short-patch-repair endonuclease
MSKGGHNRVDYHHSDLQKAKSRLTHRKIEYTGMSDSAIMELSGTYKWPRKCKNDGCENIVKTRNRYVCISCNLKGDSNPAKLPGVGDKISAAMTGKKFTSGHREKLRWAKGTKPGYEKRVEECRKSGAKGAISYRPSVKMSSAERLLYHIMRKSGIGGFKFVGNGKVAIGTYVPDFICKDRKIIIEVFGEFWHASPDKYSADRKMLSGRLASEIWERDRLRLEAYRAAGYNPHVIWEREIMNTDRSVLENRLINIYNGA